MSKILFIPFSVVSGLIAGLIGRKVFALIWGRFDDQDPPDAGDRDVSLPVLVGALAAEGAIFGVARGITDQLARRSFYRATGSWPGEEPPEPEEA